MPRYFFDTHDGDLLIRDTKGTDLSSREAARDDAHAVLGDMARDKLPDGDCRSFYVNVRGEAGSAFYTVWMAVIGRWLHYVCRSEKPGP